MTTKDKLHLLVERLAEPDAEALLRELEAQRVTPSAGNKPLSFVGMFESERGDLSTRYKETREAEFGR